MILSSQNLQGLMFSYPMAKTKTRLHLDLETIPEATILKDLDPVKFLWSESLGDQGF